MTPADHVVLIGMMGSGKSTVGRALARRLGRPFVDSDREVEARTGSTVAEIWSDRGEASFRVEERAVLDALLAGERATVVAAAGGVVIDAVNRDRLRDGGTVVWLRADPASLARRVHPGRDHRPILADDPAGTLERLSAERQAWYAEVADHIVDTDDLSQKQVVERLVDLLA